MDTVTEGYLVGAIVLIPTGTELIRTGTDLTTKLLGLGMVVVGIVAVYIRAQFKDEAGIP